MKSDEAEVVVNEPIIIVQQPIQSRVIEGENAVFKVNATGTEPIEYEWRFNGKILEDEFSAELVVLDVNKENEGVYQVVLKNPAGSKVSNEAKLTVVQPAVISGQAEGAVKLLGQAYEISVIASGSKDRLDINGTKMTQALDGATDGLLVFQSLNAVDAAAYQVGISNEAGAVISDEALVEVHEPLTIVSQLTDARVVKGAEATFKIEATGTTYIMVSVSW